MIRFCNLERCYGTPSARTWVLRRISLGIRDGAFITIIGPSGAGKSSLLNVLALRALNRRGTTIVQVTYAKANAPCGSRTIQLRDGWMMSDTSNPDLQPHEVVKQ